MNIRFATIEKIEGIRWPSLFESLLPLIRKELEVVPYRRNEGRVWDELEKTKQQKQKQFEAKMEKLRAFHRDAGLLDYYAAVEADMKRRQENNY